MALSLVLAACSAQADDYPVQPGAGGAASVGGGGGTGSGAMATARVCIVDDPRVLGSCSTTSTVSPAGLAVTVNGAPAATTAADGSFALPDTVGDSAVIGVTGAGIMPTQVVATMATGGNGISVPLVTADLFSQMLAANGVTTEAGSGSILGSVVRGTSPVTGVTVSSTPSAAFGPLFDGTTPTSFTLDATGARGVIWLPGVTVGPTQLTFHDVATSGETSVDGVQVIDGGITIVDAVLP